MIKDLESFYTYTGYIEIGSVKSHVTLDDDKLILQVTQWMGAGAIHPGSIHQYVQYWNIPESQDLIDFKFSTSSTYTDIAVNLRIPPHQLSSRRCLVGNQEIIIQKRPNASTRLN